MKLFTKFKSFGINMLAILGCLIFMNVGAWAQTTEFVYQGQLQNGGVPAAGNHDFEFLLYDALSGGTQVGSTLTKNSVAVANGIFSTKLDFGANFPGANRFLEIHVRQTGGGAFTPLAPRQQISSTPYSVKSLNADSATNATNAVNATTATNAVNATNATTATNATQLGGIASNGFIQNTTSPQASSNFSISGTGTAGIFNAATQYNISGNRVLSVVGANNFFAGVGAGSSNTGTENSFVGRDAGLASSTGNSNSFFGFGSGQTNTAGFFNAFFGAGSGSSNTSGGENSFFGHLAGGFNSTGNANSFFGKGSGFANSTGTANSFLGYQAGGSNSTGSSNVFVGAATGGTNTTGSFNTLVGVGSNVASNSLNNATAIGAGSVVSSSDTVVVGRNLDTVQVPGNLNVTGTFTGNINGAGITNLNASNIASGTLSNARLGVVPVANGGTGSATQNFVDLTNAQTIAGDKTFSNLVSGNVINSATQFNIAGGRILSNPGTRNLFAGIDAGLSNTTGHSNVFFGFEAGQANTTGTDNSFIGRRAGFNNNSGNNNSFVGSQAGFNNMGGGNNSFFGAFAGGGNSSGSFNSFFGLTAGNNTTLGSQNSFFGVGAGQSNETGENNTIVGAAANVGSANLSNATAIGAFAVVSQSNSLVLGNNVNVGIGTPTPSFKLEVVDATNTGLRVVTNASGGTVASFGANGNFRVDAPNIFGGRFTVLENGNTGIGTNIPVEKLQVSAGNIRWSNSILQNSQGGSIELGGTNTIPGSGTPFIDFHQTSLTEDYNVRLINDASGQLTAFANLNVQGAIKVSSLGAAGATALCRNASNDISTCSSSARYKSNISSFSPGLSLIKQLRPVSFNWKDGGMADMGLVAEEVAKVEPLLTTTNDKGQVEGVKYDRVGVVLINAVNEQQKQIESQQTQIDAQQKQIELLRKQNELLTMAVCSMNPKAAVCRPQN